MHKVRVPPLTCDAQKLERPPFVRWPEIVFRPRIHGVSDPFGGPAPGRSQPSRSLIGVGHKTFQNGPFQAFSCLPCQRPTVLTHGDRDLILPDDLIGDRPEVMNDVLVSHLCPV
jgi:hypothetical protein